MIGNRSRIQPSVWLQVFEIFWFHVASLVLIDSRGTWDRSHKKCHHCKLSTFAFTVDCPVLYFVIYKPQKCYCCCWVVPCSTYTTTAKSSAGFAPELKLSQTSLQTQLDIGTDCTVSAYVTVISCSCTCGLIPEWDPRSGCPVLKSLLSTNIASARIQPPPSTHSCSEFWFFSPLQSLSNLRTYPEKSQSHPIPKSPKSSPEVGADGMVLLRAWQTTFPLSFRRDWGKKAEVWVQELRLYLETQWKCFSSVISPKAVENSIIC